MFHSINKTINVLLTKKPMIKKKKNGPGHAVKKIHNVLFCSPENFHNHHPLFQNALTDVCTKLLSGKKSDVFMLQFRQMHI